MQIVDGAKERADAGGSTLRKHMVIVASAGTGKTHQLSNRFLKLLLDGEPAERILATTFTRKAAGEIFDRIIERLVEACSDDVRLRQLADELHEPALSREHCLQSLAILSQQLHRVRVDTLDAFFAEVARCFSLEMRLPGDWQIAEEAEDGRMRVSAIQQLLRAKGVAAAEQMLHWLTGSDSSRRVAESLMAQVGDMYENFVETKPEGDSAWTLIKPKPERSPEQLTKSIERLANLPLEGSIAKGVQTAVKHARSANWSSFHRATIVANCATTGKFSNKSIPPDVVEAISGILEQQHVEIWNRAARHTAAAYGLLSEFDERYWELKRDHGAIRFDDVPQLLTALPQLNSVDRLAYRLDGQIDHLLLDEFQDTGPLQWAVLKQLAQRITDDETGNRTFFCVGDIKQAIYTFRGGTSSILRQLADSKSPELPNVSVEPLNTSFRSDTAVIEFVNSVFTKMDNHKHLSDAMLQRVDDWTAKFPNHETTKESPGYACLQTSPAIESSPDVPNARGESNALDVAKPSSSPQSEKPGKSDSKKRQAQLALRFAAKTAAELHSQTPHMDIAILVDKNDSVAFLIDELLSLGVHASAEGGNPLTDSAAVRTMLSGLRFAEFPSDTAAAYLVAISPLGKELGLQPELRSDPLSLAAIAAQIRRELLSRGYGEVISRWSAALRPLCSRREWYRVQQFLDLAYAFAPSVSTRPIEFVRHVETVRKADPTASRVQVMTVHQSKGLGFERVIVCDLNHPMKSPRFCYSRDPITHRIAHAIRYIRPQERQALPAAISEVIDEHQLRLAEDRLCALYVSLTRAKHELRVIVAPGEQTLSNMLRSKAGLMRAALTSNGVAAPQTVLQEMGDPNWYQSAGLSSSVTNRRKVSVSLDSNIHLKSVASDALVDKGVEISPSELDRRRTSAFDVDRATARRFGTLIHAWLEEIEWLDAEGLDLGDQMLKQVAVRANAFVSDLDSAIQKFGNYLKQDQVVRLLSKQSYIELAKQSHQIFQQLAAEEDDLPLFQSTANVELTVHNELHVATTKTDEVWGTIDRLVLWKIEDQVVAAHILDFKTDAEKSSDSKLRQSYAEQLNAYRRAVADTFSLPEKQIATDLVIVSTGKLVSVGPTIGR